MGTLTGATGLAPGGGRWRALVLPLLVVVAGLLLTAAPARADFHLMSIREVYPGAANDSYVMLQMYSPSQTNLNGHQIVVYGSTGSAITTFTFVGGVANGESQRTVLVADDGYAAGFPSGPAPDRTHAALDIPSGGGAVCFVSVDCVAWGNFGGSIAPNPGPPAAPSGVTPGKALRRSIAAGCSTLLEPGDDTDNSAANFSEQDPNPRSNASPIVETACPVLPNTTIGTKPPNPTKSTSASFTFTANPAAGASFECKLDAEPGFTSCSSPKVYTELSEASHTFQVRAVNSAGADPTPASYSWKIDSTAPPETTIKSKPPDPSGSSVAFFTYESSQPGSTFECKLDAALFASCPAGGIEYTGLANGTHSFQVRAVDGGLKDATPAGYSWDVAVGTTEPPPLFPPPPAGIASESLQPLPPQTILTGKPAAVTRDRTPTFRFRSSAAGSSFGCRVDRGGFRPCSSPFTTKRLSFGAHVVQVRATAGGLADLSPAKSSFRIVKPKGKRRGR